MNVLTFLGLLGEGDPSIFTKIKLSPHFLGTRSLPSSHVLYKLKDEFYYLGCVWKSLSKAYLSLSFHINTFNKNHRCLEELIKIAYDPLISHF